MVHADPGELAMVEQVDNRRVQAIKLLNDTDAYEMATTISDSVEDTLKFFDDLGTLFRNGTLATYICPTARDENRCEIYALPNGSVPLKKSVIKLVLGVFSTTQLKYGDLRLGGAAWKLFDNWCFPEFLIRYNNYDETVYKTFVKDISTLIYHELTVVGLCLGIGPVYEAERAKHRSELSEQVRGIMQHILDARWVLNEEPPARPTRPPAATTRLNTWAQRGPNFPPPKGGRNTVSDDMKKVVAAQAAKERGLETLSWTERPAKYYVVLRRSIEQLKNGYSGVTLSGAMYLPYAKGEKSQHCFVNVTVVGYNVNGGNYVIKHTSAPADKMSILTARNTVASKKNAILDHVFSGGDDLCKRVKAKLNTLDTVKRGFSGFAAVACGKKFVWYQLAYKYFPAAAAGGEAVTINSTSFNTYNPNCGQIIFFP